MLTTKQLEREIARLKKIEGDKILRLRTEKEMLEMRRKQQTEKEKLETELKRLKHPGRGIFQKKLIRGLKVGFHILARAGEDVDRAVKSLRETQKKKRELEILKLKVKTREKRKVRKPSRKKTIKKKVKRRR